jgi:predicted peptidase
VYKQTNGKALPYRLMLPINYDSTKTYPLVVCLHGSSGCGSDNYKQVVTALPAYMLSADSIRSKYPAFLLVPQCPLKSTWGGIAGLPSVDSLVIETIQFLQDKFPIDKNRMYVTGNSLGGYGTWHLIGHHPEMFAAAVPICGSGDPELAPNMMNIPIWAFHGTKDQNVPVSGSRNVIEAIKKAGGKPLYTEFPDEAHDITKKVIDTRELVGWLFSQSKNPRLQ